MTVTVIDLGLGNVGSVANMLRKVGAPSEVTSAPDVVAVADRIVLPGVGAFDSAMDRLRDRGLIDALNRRVMVDRVPVLGICLGMQLLADGSEEGEQSGLGWIPGRVRRLPSTGPTGAPVKVPHMGWSELVQTGNGPEWTADTSSDSRFYFVHSFAFQPEDPSNVIATADYGSGPFCAAVGSDNVVGVQFHPEKSHRHGMALLRRFVEATG